jgi:peroxiredoxin
MPRIALIILITFLSSFTFNSKSLPDFKLKNTDGKYVSLKDYKDAKGFIIVFTCNHCPFAKLYAQRLNKLHEKYAPLHVPLIAISSTSTFLHPEDSYSEMVKIARQKKFTFPYLYDEMQSIARFYSATRTPQAFVIWKNGINWEIAYNGAIDDNGADESAITHHYIEEAVNSLLCGKEVAVKHTASIGCVIQFDK